MRWWLNWTRSPSWRLTSRLPATPNLQNKWLARSAFQKAIRRGRTEEALLCGANLAASDPESAWRTLATIIVEDVGFGDLDLLSYSTIAPLKTVRKMLKSPARLFMGMVIRACASVKSRSACELSLGADKDPETPWEHSSSNLATTNCWR